MAIKPITHSIELQMEDTGAKDTGIRLKQGDAGISFYIYPTYEGESYFDTNVIPNVCFRRADGSSVVGKCTYDSSGFYIYTILGTELAIAGKLVMDLKFQLSAGRESTHSVIMECVADTIGGTVEMSGLSPSDIYDAINKLEEEFDEAQRVIPEVEGLIYDARQTMQEPRFTEVAEGVERATDAAERAERSDQSANSSAALAGASASRAQQADQSANAFSIVASNYAGEAKSAANRAEQAAEKTEGFPFAAKKSGNPLELLSSDAPLLDFKIEGFTHVSKNMLKPTLETETQNGVTCTKNGDGTYTLNGTASSDTDFEFAMVSFTQGTRYKLLGTPSSVGESAYIYVQNIGADKGNGIVFENASGSIKIGLYILRGTLFNNSIYKPMITTDTSLTYDDFEPYGMTSLGDQWGVVDLGDLNWQKSGNGYFDVTISDSKENTKNAFIDGYSIDSVDNVYICKNDMTFAFNGHNIWIVNKACNTSQEFKSAMKGHKLYFEPSEGVSADYYVRVDESNSDNTKSQTVFIPVHQPLQEGDYIRHTLAGYDIEHREMGVVDLGSLDWVKAVGATASIVEFASASISSAIKKVRNDEKANIFCEKYETCSADETWSGKVGIAVRADGIIRCHDTTSYSDASAFKSAMSGVMLVYEKAEPTDSNLWLDQQKEVEKIQTYEKQTTIETDKYGNMSVMHCTDNINGEAIAMLTKTILAFEGLIPVPTPPDDGVVDDGPAINPEG